MSTTFLRGVFPLTVISMPVSLWSEWRQIQFSATSFANSVLVIWHLTGNTGGLGCLSPLKPSHKVSHFDSMLHLLLEKSLSCLGSEEVCVSSQHHSYFGTNFILFGKYPLWFVVWCCNHFFFLSLSKKWQFDYFFIILVVFDGFQGKGEYKMPGLF